MKSYDENSDAAEARLKPLLTGEFLKTIALAVRTHGHSGDHIECASFVSWCFEIAGKERPNLDPFNYAEGDGA
jgi:hypothetical protein